MVGRRDRGKDGGYVGERGRHGFIQREDLGISPQHFPFLKFDNYMYTKHQLSMNTVSLFTFKEPLPNIAQQQNQKKAKQTIKNIFNTLYVLFKPIFLSF